MMHTSIQIQRSISGRRRSASPRIRVAALAIANQSHSLAVAIFGAVLVLMVFMQTAHAVTEGTPELAAMPNATVPVLPRATSETITVRKHAVELRGLCRNGAAVFTIKNNMKRWAGRGHVRILDGQTGHMLRERWMRFNEGQSASFHIASGLVASHRYKISVMLPDRTMIYKKSFRGRCAQPSADVRNARR